MSKRSIDIVSPLRPINEIGSKKSKRNIHVVVPQCIRNQSLRINVPNRNIVNELLGITCAKYSPNNLMEYLDSRMDLDQIFAENKTAYLFLFFGPVHQAHVELINEYYAFLITKFPLRILAVTGTGTSHSNPRADEVQKWNFPIIEDEKGFISKTFNVLDPLGGGIYPLDRIVLVDASGYARAVISPKSSINNPSSSYYSTNFLSDEVELDKLLECLVECIGYLCNDEER